MLHPSSVYDTCTLVLFILLYCEFVSSTDLSIAWSVRREVRDCTELLKPFGSLCILAPGTGVNLTAIRHQTRLHCHHVLIASFNNTK